MKKFVLALLAVVLVLGLCTVAMAEATEPAASAPTTPAPTTPTCTHVKWTRTGIVASATCTANAQVELTCACGTTKVVDAANWFDATNADHAQYFSKGGHDWSKKNDNETGAADCTTGYNVEYFCTRCPATKTEKVEGVAHVYNIFVEVVQKGDCTHDRIEKMACSCGATTNVKVNVADGHNYTMVKGVGNICVENVIDTFVCLDCGDKQGEYQYELVYNKDGELCEIAPFGSDKGIAVNNKAEGHKWNPAVVINAKTCEKDGLSSKECKVCGLVETFTVACTGHAWSAWTVVAEPRCEEDGLKVAFCTVCNDAALDNSVRKTEVIPKLGHTVKVADETKAATCTEAGYTKGRCIVCEKTVTTTTEPTGHAYGEWTIKDGLKYKVCANCNDIVVETVAPETPADPDDKPATGDDDDNNSEGTGSSTGSGSDASIPATGDNTSNVPYIMMVAAVAGLVVLVASKRKVNC